MRKPNFHVPGPSTTHRLTQIDRRIAVGGLMAANIGALKMIADDSADAQIMRKLMGAA